jgi:hypothetical protein
MNPELSWRSERESVDHLLAQMASDPDFKRRVVNDPASIIGDMPMPSLVRHAKPTKCGPLKTSCPPGQTCGKGKSCVKTSISIA